MSNPIVKELLDDIKESVELVLSRTETVITTEDFLKDDIALEKLDAVSMRLQVIGETLKKMNNIDAEILSKHPEIEWEKIIRLRDFISHHYFDLDAEIIFDVVKNHLPQLRKSINKIILDLNKEK